MIEVTDLKKVYAKRTVVDHVTARFETGRITGIVGRNGSGKTVMFRMICGLTIPTEGTVVVDGKRIGVDVDFPPSLGAIIETPGFIGMESGLQNLMGLAMLRKRIGKEDVARSMERVGLDPKERKPVKKYSLGMRQRLGIAQAIMENPDVLILDEPTNGLDNNGVKEIRALLLGMRNEGRTILVASHNMEDIAVMCDTVYEMDNGVLTRHEEA